MVDGKPPALITAGWREWVTLPELNVSRIKAKLDTGARSSALHAFNVDLVERNGSEYVTFEVHPRQRSARKSVRAEAEVIEFRQVRDSGGHVTTRPVIVTHVKFFGKKFPIELTLANRDAMGFRLLLGREAMRGRFVIDPLRSYLAGTPKPQPTDG